MVGPEGVGCLSDVLHRGSRNHRVMRVLSLYGTPLSTERNITGELIAERTFAVL